MLKTTITDSGNGIASKLLPGLFETFSIMKSGLNQLQSETSGIGVGLTTAKALVEALGGQIKIESSNTGTKAQFTVAVTNKHNIASFAKDLNEGIFFQMQQG